MCTFNIEIEDSIVSRIRSSFKSEAEIKHWMQNQMVNMILNLDATSTSTNKTYHDRESALGFIKSLAVQGGERVPVDVSGMESLISEKYE